MAPGSFSRVPGEPGFEARLLTIGPQRPPNSHTFSMFLKIWRSRPRPHNDKLRYLSRWKDKDLVLIFLPILV